MNRLGIKSREIKQDSRKQFIKEPTPIMEKIKKEPEPIKKLETIASSKDFSIESFTADSEDFIKQAKAEAEQEEREKRQNRKNKQQPKKGINHE